MHGILQQEYWNRVPFPSPGDPPNPGIKPRSPVLHANSLPSEPLPIFSSRSFVVLGLTFRPLIDFKFIFVCGVRKCSNSLHVAIQ